MPDYLIHCAAISDTGYCQNHEEESYAMNVKAVDSIARACQQTGTNLIFCSSDQIYFGSPVSSVPHTEDETVTPMNLYGKHKLMAEDICAQVCPASVILRLTWMYDIKKLSEKEHGNFYSNVKSALEHGDICSFPVHDYRGITYVWSVIENLEKALALPGGIYNFGSEKPYTTYDTVRQLFDKKGIAANRLVPNIEAFQDNPRNIAMNIDKLRAHGIDFDATLPMLINYW